VAHVARSLSIKVNIVPSFSTLLSPPKILSTRCPAFSAKLSRVSLATSLSCPALSLLTATLPYKTVGLVKGPCPNILPKRLCAFR
jgi:hypothetical protein